MCFCDIVLKSTHFFTNWWAIFLEMYPLCFLLIMILNLSKSVVSYLLLNLSIFLKADVAFHLSSRLYDLTSLVNVPVLHPLKTLGTLSLVRVSLLNGYTTLGKAFNPSTKTLFWSTISTITTNFPYSTP